MLLTLLIASSANAGVAYRTSGGARVWIEGDRKRVELKIDPESPRTYDVAITAGEETTYINLTNGTYFREPRSSVEASSLLFHLIPMGEDRIKGRPKISYRSAGSGPALGEHATIRHAIQFAYRLVGESMGHPIQADVESALSFATAPSLPRESGQHLVHTGFAQIDGEIARLIEATEGMIVSFEITISRRFKGGPTVTETKSMLIEDLVIQGVDESIFVIPSGLTYQKPVYGVPGK